MTLPPYHVFPDLPGENILLRQVLISDIKDIVAISYYDAKQAKSADEAIEMLKKIDQDYSNGNSIHWGIEDSSEKKIVGTCGYYRGLDKGTGELGCVLSPGYQGKGYMTKAIRLAIDFGIHQIGLNRIIAITSKQNHRALKLLGRLKFNKVFDLEGGEVEYEIDIKKITATRDFY